MSRVHFDPSDFGIHIEQVTFDEQLAADFQETFGGRLSFTELLLRPRTAAFFCDTIRQRRGYYDVPDDVILRAIMHRRRRSEEVPLAAEKRKFG